jgi:hypothetical protein
MMMLKGRRRGSTSAEAVPGSTPVNVSDVVCGAHLTCTQLTEPSIPMLSEPSYIHATTVGAAVATSGRELARRHAAYGHGLAHAQHNTIEVPYPDNCE